MCEVTFVKCQHLLKEAAILLNTRGRKRSTNESSSICHWYATMPPITVDNRNRSSAPTTSITRSKRNQTERELKYVAWHHFHPSAIKNFAVSEGKLNYSDLIPASFVKASIESGYSEEDKFDNEHYFFVPSYTCDKAQADLEDLQHVNKLLEIGEEISQRKRGSVARRSDRADKRARHSSEDLEDLKCTSCSLKRAKSIMKIQVTLRRG